ncbi:ABC transporter ATP-binding protein [Micromonospora yangpuensis]|uniref:ATP-binding cassette, subfamily B n=1 Tax=Micromonospora yangpuensis TaxID=683228 RepID=A0A1C6V9Q6_9ACTN|nr:ABC transporter ATP-binding protein [Micromonospora yangpuensis]SCL62887.1 ATP-binding cassette, subfamily B [Micromonospora yangpuensis]
MPAERDREPAPRASAGRIPPARGTGAGRRLANLWRLRRYLRPYAVQFAWLLVAALTATAAGLAVPLVVQRVVDGPVARQEPGGLLRLGALVLLLGLVEAALIFIRRWMQAESSIGMETALRADLYAHLLRLPTSFHDRWHSGQLLSRAVSDLSVLRRFLSFGLFFLVLNLVTYAAVVVLLVRLHRPLGLLVAASAVPLFLISRRFARHYHAASRRMQDQQGDVATLVEETALGLRTMKAYGRGPQLSARFGAGARALHDIGIGKARLLARTSAQFDLVPNLTLGGVLVAGTVLVADGRLTVGALVAFVSLQLMLIWPVQSLGWIIANGQEAATAADRIQEVLDTRPTIVDAPGAIGLRRTEVRGRLVFDRVSFRYPQSAAPVLREVELTVEPGETLALVGATGCGKSTLLSLVPRLHEVTGGRITLDGHDLRELRLATLRRLVGVAFEEPTLFSMSVWENLTLGRPEADEAEVRAALVLAQAEFAYDLPWGLATRVGEQGLSLSGGQRQRLALARAVLGRPALLVLDDPLSALDVHTEALVERALRRVLRDTTALLVVHRPSTVALADRVALLERGRITAVGTHSELLATVPAYRALLSAEPTPTPASAPTRASTPVSASTSTPTSVPASTPTAGRSVGATPTAGRGLVSS